MNRKLKKQLNEIELYLHKNLSKERLAHSYHVARYAQQLAKTYGKRKKTAQLAYFSGLAHDICKELSDKEQLDIFHKTGEKLTKIEKQRINLLHGATGAYVLEKKFDVKNSQVLEAVKYHTFGAKKLRTLGKLIFVADKIEPSRGTETAEHFRRIAGRVSFNELVFQVLSSNIEYVEKKGGIVSPHSHKMQKKLARKLHHH